MKIIKCGIIFLLFVSTFWLSDAGTVYKTIIKNGTGPIPQKNQTVVVHYTGKLQSGEQFDSSRDRNEPFKFKLGAGEVIRGWDAGVSTMQVGERSELEIAPEDGYGAEGYPPVIPPSATLLFDIELLAIEGMTPMPSQPVFSLNDVMPMSSGSFSSKGLDTSNLFDSQGFSSSGDGFGSSGDTFRPSDIQGSTRNEMIPGMPAGQAFSIDLSRSSTDSSFNMPSGSSSFGSSQRSTGGSSMSSLEGSVSGAMSAGRSRGSPGSTSQFPSPSMDGPFDLGRTGRTAMFGNSGASGPMVNPFPGRSSDRAANFGSSAEGPFRDLGGTSSAGGFSGRIPSSAMGSQFPGSDMPVGRDDFTSGSRSAMPSFPDPRGGGFPGFGGIDMPQDPRVFSAGGSSAPTGPGFDRFSSGRDSLTPSFTRSTGFGPSPDPTDMGMGFGSGGPSPVISGRDLDMGVTSGARSRGFTGRDVGAPPGFDASVRMGIGSMEDMSSSGGPFGIPSGPSFGMGMLSFGRDAGTDPRSRGSPMIPDMGPGMSPDMMAGRSGMPTGSFTLPGGMSGGMDTSMSGAGAFGPARPSDMFSMGPGVSPFGRSRFGMDDLSSMMGGPSFDSRRGPGGPPGMGSGPMRMPGGMGPGMGPGMSPGMGPGMIPPFMRARMPPFMRTRGFRRR